MGIVELPTSNDELSNVPRFEFLEFATLTDICKQINSFDIFQLSNSTGANWGIVVKLFPTLLEKGLFAAFPARSMGAKPWPKSCLHPGTPPLSNFDLIVDARCQVSADYLFLSTIILLFYFCFTYSSCYVIFML